MTSRDEALRALEKAVELVAKATPDAWAYAHGEIDDHVGRTLFDTICATEDDAIAVVSVVNFIREHGAAILSARQEVAPVAWLKELDGGGLKCVPRDFPGAFPVHRESPAQTSEARDAAAILAWAVERWHAEVAQRPLMNAHRRSLDDCWRQVVRRCGEDDVVLLGPRHDDLVAAMRQEAGSRE